MKSFTKSGILGVSMKTDCFNIAVGQYYGKSGQWHGALKQSMIGRKMANKFEVRNTSPNFCRPTVSTENLKVKKKLTNRPNRIDFLPKKQQNNIRNDRINRICTSVSSSQSNMSKHTSSKSQRTEKKSYNNLIQLKQAGYKGTISSKSKSKSNSKSIRKGTKSKSPNKYPQKNVSLTKKMQKATSKKKYNPILKKSINKRHLSSVQPFTINEQDLSTERNYQFDPEIKQYIAKKRNRKVKQQVQIRRQNVEKNQIRKIQLQKLQVARKYNLKNSLANKKGKNQKQSISNIKVCPESSTEIILQPKYYDNINKKQDKFKPKRRISNLTARKTTGEQPKVSVLNPSVDHQKITNENILSQRPLNHIERPKQIALIDKYMKGVASSRDYYWLVSAVVTIQKYWKGHQARKLFSNKINHMRMQYQKTEKVIRNKQKYWLEDSGDSIVQIDTYHRILGNQQHHQSKSMESQSGLQNSQQQNHSYPSSLDNLIHKLYRKHKQVPQYIDDESSFEKSEEKTTKDRESQERDQLSQVQELRKKLQQRQQKYKVLENQHNRLKLAKEQQSKNQKLKTIQIEKHISQEFNNSPQDSIQSCQVVSDRRYQTPDSSSNNRQGLESGDVIKISNYDESEEPLSSKDSKTSSEDFERYKQKLQQCQRRICNSPPVSPSSGPVKLLASQEYESPRSGIKFNKFSDYNITKMFKMKEIKVDQLFQKKALMFQHMYNQKILSPRTYQVKIVGLRDNTNKEKQEIHHKLQQAKSLFKYMQNIQSQVYNKQPNETQKEDMSPISKIQSPRQFLFRLNEDSFDSPSLDNIQKQINELDKRTLSKFRETEQNIVEKKRRGFQTSWGYIKDFCVSLADFQRKQYRDSLLSRLSKPIESNPLLLLKAYRTNQREENLGSYNMYEQDLIYPYFRHLIDRQCTIDRQQFEVFINLVNKKQKRELNSKYANNVDDQTMEGLRFYFQEVIFDTFNEALEYQKPYGVVGSPLPWDYKTNNLKNYSNLKVTSKCNDQYLTEWQIEEVQSKIDRMLGKGIEKVMNWARSLCGLIPETMGDSNQTFIYSQCATNDIKEKRMALMIQKYVSEMDTDMIRVQPHEIEVKLYLTEHILTTLLIELADDVYKSYH